MERSNLDSWMNEKQASAFLGVKPTTMQQWRWQRRGPRYAKFGNLVKFRRSDLLEWCETRMIETRDSRTAEAI